MRQTIAALLETGHPTLEEVARRLHVSPRTLQRHLSDHGFTHSKLVDDVRLSYATRWIRDTTIPIAVIAERLGYADPGSFSRAFGRWTGVPPRTFRANIKCESQLARSGR
jgi:AraC-like DNA-binding protein